VAVARPEHHAVLAETNRTGVSVHSLMPYSQASHLGVALSAAPPPDAPAWEAALLFTLPPR
jgi:hypothetical protein